MNEDAAKRVAGDQLLELTESAEEQLTLIAPFFQREALSRVLLGLSPHVTLTVLTRWRPLDLISGVSDPSIWNLLASRPRSSIALRSDLHAKLYRADRNCLVGSANVTLAGLGWAACSNAELLWPLRPVPARILQLEHEWLANARIADEEMYEWALSLISESRKPSPGQADGEDEPHDFWWPKVRQPKDLWAASIGHSLPPKVLNSAAEDLLALSVPSGLDATTFHEAVKGALRQTPAVNWVNACLATPRRFGWMRDAIAQKMHSVGVERSAGEAWQTMIRWLLHFLPEDYEYSRPRHTEVMALSRRNYGNHV